MRGERESYRDIQREEAPSVFLDPETRKAMGAQAVQSRLLTVDEVVCVLAVLEDSMSFTYVHDSIRYAEILQS